MDRQDIAMILMFVAMALNIVSVILNVIVRRRLRRALALLEKPWQETAWTAWKEVEEL